MDNPDWTLWRSFLQVAETGSLSAAARLTGASQPTVGRHIKALEAALSVTLFTRAARGLELTEAGADLVAPARRMAAAAAELALAAAGRVEALSGTVRITASRIVSHHVLPGILAALRRGEPEIEIELLPTDTTENLLFREADIAVRMYRPTEPDLIATHVADLATGLYAAKSFLDRVGRPTTEPALLALDFVGFLTSDQIVRAMAGLGIARRLSDFPVRCDDQVIYWNLVRAGCGIGGAQRSIGDADPLVERIAGFVDLPAQPVWLTAPEALRHSPRIRRVYDHLATAFRALPHLDPAAAFG